MLGKSIIAGTVISLMAGGAVYYGTDIQADSVKDKVSSFKAEMTDKIMSDNKEHPHGTKADKVEKSTATPSIKTSAGKIIEAKKPSVSHSKTQKTAEAPKTEKPKSKWIDQYLKKEASEAVDDSDAGASTKDTGTFIVEDKDTAEIELFVETETEEEFEEKAREIENIWIEKSEKEPSETGTKRASKKMLSDIIKKDRAIVKRKGKDGREKNVEVKVMAGDDGRTRVETETIDMGDGKVMKIIKKTMTSDMDHDEHGDKKMRVKVLMDDDSHGGMDTETIEMDGGKVIKIRKAKTIDEALSKAKPIDVSKTIETVMTQAEKIEMPELRDRAYLDLVSFALEHCAYDTAETAMGKIKQVELRDTARNRMAVAYAKAGETDKAFALLEEIEVEALKDVMRLQVIEAMIAPEELHEDMQ